MQRRFTLSPHSVSPATLEVSPTRFYPPLLSLLLPPPLIITLQLGGGAAELI